MFRGQWFGECASFAFYFGLCGQYKQKDGRKILPNKMNDLWPNNQRWTWRGEDTNGTEDCVDANVSSDASSSS